MRNLHDVVKLNGTINKAYEQEYSDYVRHLEPETPFSVTADSTIGRAAAVEVDEIIQKALAAVENRSYDIKPPSPTKSLDEIVPESEVIDQLTEKKAGNGALYFTDEIKTDDESEDFEDGDTNNAIAMLDDVLEDEEMLESRKISDVSSMMPHSHEAIATAIVHQENVEEEDEEKNDENNNQEKAVEKEEKSEEAEKETEEVSIKAEVYQKPEVEEILMKKEEEKVEPEVEEISLKEEEKPVFASTLDPDNDIDNKEFIKKLNTLFLQKTVPNRKLTPNEDESLQQSPSKRPSLLHSKSEHATLERKPSNIDHETGETLFPSDSDSSIPKPPVFDADLYKSIGRAKSDVVLKEMSLENNPKRPSVKKFHAPPPPMPPKSPPSSPEEKVLTIKEKLEAIFSNSLPVRLQKQVPPSNVTEKDSNPDKENSSPEMPKREEVERVSSFKTKAKKFDTVEKQRAIFANVIKEINPDKPKSLQSTPSFNRRQLTEVFKLDNSDSRRSSARSNVKVSENSGDNVSVKSGSSPKENVSKV